MAPKKFQYAVWEIDGDHGYWAMHDSMADAVQSNNGRAIVYRIKATKLGLFKSVNVLKRIKVRRTKKKAAKR